jgi:predicted ATPase/DNA-binding SARP family transcriptional activator
MNPASPAAVASKADGRPLEIRLFGPLEVSLHGMPLPPLRSQRAKWLLALLALRHGREVERMWLAGTLWPDSTDAQATLRRILTDLRHALGDQADRINSTSRTTLRFDVKDASVDVIAFDRAITRGDQTSLEQAVSLYRGPLLEGCSEEWVIQDREVREQAYLNALESLADLAVSRAEFSRAADYLQLAVSIDPLRECAQRSLMKAFSACGDHSAAVEVYRDLRLHLRNELNTEPDPETINVYEQIRQRAKERAMQSRPPMSLAPSHPPSGSRQPSTIPHALTSLVGREQELREIKARLSAARLVTLTGAGGVGKTRLAIQAVHEISGEFVDGAVFVDLAPISDPNLVAQTVASNLDIREEPGQSLAETLAHLLVEKQLLLVLDNCEHLLNACAHLVASLLMRCPELRILATSRQSLGVTGEVDWRVPSLSLPKAGGAITDLENAFQEAVESGAVRLFAERAAAARADFVLSRQSAPRVAEICRRLEGIPLAIELAAARTKLLSLEEIEARLDDAFQLLTAGSRTALPRQQTLQAAMDWSYSLLETPERLLLQRLSLFAAPFGMEAVRAICCDGQVPEAFVEQLLGSLVDKSLVTPLHREGDSRYRLLEITRAYARRLLGASGEEEGVQQRYADYFLSLVEQDDEEWQRHPEIALSRIDAFESDLRAVLDWCASRSEGRPFARRALRMAKTLAVHCQHRGRATEERNWLDKLLRLLPERTESRAYALLQYSKSAVDQEDYQAACTAAEEARSLFQEIGNRRGVAFALRGLGQALYTGLDASAAIPVLEEALQIYRDLNDTSAQPGTLTHLGLAFYALGDYGRSRAYHEEVLAIVSAQGSELGKSWSLDNLGDVALAEGDPDRASALFRRSLPWFATTRHLIGIAECLRGLAQAAAARGGSASARRAAVLFGAVDALRLSLGPVDPIFREGYRRAVERTRLPLGEEAFSAAWTDGHAMPMEAAVAIALEPETE